MKKLLIGVLVFLCSGYGAIWGQTNYQNSNQIDLVLVAWNVEHLAENNDEGCFPKNNRD
jgi:hypothetical protein